MNRSLYDDANGTARWKSRAGICDEPPEDDSLTLLYVLAAVVVAIWVWMRWRPVS